MVIPNHMTDLWGKFSCAYARVLYLELHIFIFYERKMDALLIIGNN